MVIRPTIHYPREIAAFQTYLKDRLCGYLSLPKEEKLLEWEPVSEKPFHWRLFKKMHPEGTDHDLVCTLSVDKHLREAHLETTNSQFTQALEKTLQNIPDPSKYHFHVTLHTWFGPSTEAEIAIPREWID